MENAERFWSKVNKSGECWEWGASFNTTGRGQFKLNGMMVLAHRLSYVMNHPITIDLMEGHREILVCHRCDNPKCVNPSHLFLGSHNDNTKDMMDKGRHHDGKGEKCPTSKLTEAQVREIRIKYANGRISQRQLALEYGVHQATIFRIILRRTWSHI